MNIDDKQKFQNAILLNSIKYIDDHVEAFVFAPETKAFWDESDIKCDEKKRYYNVMVLSCFSKQNVLECDKDICSICYNSNELNGKMDACNHFFCLSCLLSWSEKNNHCPLCRKKFYQVIHKNIGIVRYVFQSKDLRQYINETLPQLSKCVLHLEYENRSITFL